MFDINNADHRLALKNEVIKDPKGLGYQAVIDAKTTDALNLLNTPSANPDPEDQVSIPAVDYVIDVIDRIDTDEYAGLSAAYKTVVDNFIVRATGGENIEFSPARGLFKQAFGEDSKTWAALSETKTRQASRAEILFGIGSEVTRQNWIDARES